MAQSLNKSISSLYVGQALIGPLSYFPGNLTHADTFHGYAGKATLDTPVIDADGAKKRLPPPILLT